MVVSGPQVPGHQLVNGVRSVWGCCIPLQAAFWASFDYNYDKDKHDLINNLCVRIYIYIYVSYIFV